MLARGEESELVYQRSFGETRPGATKIPDTTKVKQIQIPWWAPQYCASAAEMRKLRGQL